MRQSSHYVRTGKGSMQRPDDSDDLRPLRALALMSEIGFGIAIPILLGVFGGNYIDERLGTGGLFLVGGVLLGVASGMYNAYRLIAKVMEWKR